LQAIKFYSTNFNLLKGSNCILKSDPTTNKSIFQQFSMKLDPHSLVILSG